LNKQENSAEALLKTINYELRPNKYKLKQKKYKLFKGLEKKDPELELLDRLKNPIKEAKVNVCKIFNQTNKKNIKSNYI
jgi:hypothetical protein